MAVGGVNGPGKTLEIDAGTSRATSPSHAAMGNAPPGGYFVQSENTGTTAVHEYLSAVKEELDFIASQMLGPGGKVQGIDMQEVERLVQHLEVDREELSERCQRLMEEKKELLDAKTHVENELYTAKRELEEAQRKLRHQEVDLQRLRGGSADAEPSQQTASSDDDKVLHESLEAMHALNLKQSEESASSAIRQASRLDLVRALRISQDELLAERARAEKLEKRLRKDRQRLQLLEDAAEGQRQEILAIRQKKQQKIAAQPELAGKTKILHHLAHTSPVHREVKPGPSSPFGDGSNASADHPLAIPAGDLSRSASAPTKLPKMRGRMVPI